MIYVRVEMWPKGSRTRRRVLGEALIENRGGTESRADYRALFSKKGGFRASEEDMARMSVKNVWKETEVPGYPRSRIGFWYLLVCLLLLACGDIMEKVGLRKSEPAGRTGGHGQEPRGGGAPADDRAAPVA